MKNTKWSQLWLSYHNIGDSAKKWKLTINGFDISNRTIKSLTKELKLALEGFSGSELTEGEEADVFLTITRDDTLASNGYILRKKDSDISVASSDENGALYGIFHLLRLIGTGRLAGDFEEKCEPDNPLRMMNHWDNMDGSIERGYSGRSFFFNNNEIIVDERTEDYARFMASIGINAVVINNVNVKQAASDMITVRYFDKLRELSDVLADYGISMFLSLNFASPIEIGHMDNCDPLNPEVVTWWEYKCKEVFDALPNLGGFLVKADSEGRPGPFTYGRTQADGANMLADVVKPYGKIIIWRCFVYNCTQDWRDRKTDRARAGFDYFKPLDREYHDNVILQIKNGPMDFQIREPVSPLLGGLTKTNQMLEVQIAQEYTGHQIDLCYLIPMFREILDFHTYCQEGPDTVADIISGRAFGNKNCGMAAVINTGNDLNWTGNYLAAANTYGFGRLSFDMSLSSEEIAREWVKLTFDVSEDICSKIVDMLLRSRNIYEKYTCPLGIGWMVTPETHYGPSVDGYEYSRWGTYHRADHLGIGVDRSDNGTGYARQYYPQNADKYNDPASCPEELLLFFHHIPYTWKLQDGRTLIQYIYDSHFEGENEAEQLAATWDQIKEELPSDIYEAVKHRFEMQIHNAKEWRDQVNSYFYRKSGIPDEQNRVIY